MPKCLKCGSYYIRAPCPVCSPLGIGELIVDSEESKKKSIDDLQNEFKDKLSKLDARKTELTNQINSMTEEIISLEDQFQSHEVTKIGINDRIKKLKLAIEQVENEISEILSKNSVLEQEKDTTTQRIANLEETNNKLKTELSLVQKEIEEKEVQNNTDLQEDTKPQVEEPSTFNKED